jgi:hypothetical protein
MKKRPTHKGRIDRFKNAAHRIIRQSPASVDMKNLKRRGKSTESLPIGEQTIESLELELEM